MPLWVSAEVSTNRIRGSKGVGVREDGGVGSHAGSSVGLEKEISHVVGDGAAIIGRKDRGEEKGDGDGSTKSDCAL